MRRLHLNVLGTLLRVEFQTPAALEQFRIAWSEFIVTQVPGDATGTVVVDEASCEGSVLRSVIDAALSQRVASRELRFLGLALEATRGYATIVLGLPPHVQADVVLASVSLGYRYLTSSVVCLSPLGLVNPAPLPLMVEGAGRPAVVRGPAEFGVPLSVVSSPIRRIVVASAHAPEDRLVSCELAEAVVLLARHLRDPARHHRVLIEVLSLLDRGVEVMLTGARSPQRIVDLLESWRDHPRSGVQRPSWAAIPLDPRLDSSATWALMDGRIRQTPYRDAVEIDDGAAVLGIGAPVQLSSLGRTIWGAAAGAPTPEELVTRVVAAHGPHPQAEELVGEAVLSMVDAGLLGYAVPEPIEPYLTALQVGLAVRQAPSSKE